VVICGLATLADAATLKVAVFGKALGGKAIHKALGKQKGIEASLVTKLDADALFANDVLIIGAASLDRPEQIKAIRIFVECGGGLILNHNSCGRGRPETPFPKIVKKVSGRREDTVLVVDEGEHPLTLGLPAEFDHAYYDHLLMEPGPNGVALIKDREDSVVVVIGTSGLGRVVFNGSIPGYRYDPATYHQGEAEPSGGELMLVVNAIRWAGTYRLSKRPPEEVAAQRKELEDLMSLDEMRKLLPTSDWFGEEMLRGSYLPRQPVTELGGRFFITYDSMCWRGYKLRRVSKEKDIEFYRNRIRVDVKQLKWLGVTDIMLWTDVSGDQVEHHTDVPDSTRMCGPLDTLAELAKAAEEEGGMGVWAAWHSCSRRKDFAEKYCARDAEGEFYKYGTRDYVEDLLSPAYRQRCRQLLDEYATKYKEYKSFRGLACYDELWFTFYDYHGDDLSVFAQFCRERFGEELPDDAPKRLAKGRGWNDASDVWRRRYILFKQHVITEFWRELVTHAHRRGLEIGLQLLDTARYSSGWSWGMDSVVLARLGADFYNTGCNESPATSYPNTLRWCHVHGTWGVYNTHCLRGGPGGIYFTFNHLWRLIMYANNPYYPRELARHIHNQRQWANAEPLARVAVLHNQNALQMLQADSRPQVNRDQALFNAIQRSQDADLIFTRAHERHAAYRTLIAPPYSVRGLSAELLAKLKSFVENGGVIVSVNADWSVARPDLTQERDATAEIVGVAYAAENDTTERSFMVGETEVSLLPETPKRAAKAQRGTQTLIQYADGSGPAVTEKTVGKGKIIGLHFEIGAELEKRENPELVACLSTLVQQASQPAIRAEGTGFRVVSTLKKGNWIAVALFPDQVPTVATLHVDPQALGIQKDGFRMLMLGKEMEISRPGDIWGESGFWSAAELKKGFKVTIAAHHDRTMPLPEKWNLSRYTEWAQGYIENVGRSWWDSEARGKRKRTYAHEIVVLAPGDEPVMPRK